MPEIPFLQTASVVLLVLGVLGSSLGHADFRDPTRPPATRSVEKKDAPTAGKGHRWVLTSTVISPHRRIALINGTPVAEGQRIDGARLVEILPQAVTLRQGNRTFKIRLSAGGLKRSTTATDEEKRAK